MTSEQKNQLHDREQFRRYAEAALAGMKVTEFSSYEMIPEVAFRTAQKMMLAESEAFEWYQLMASQVAIDEERKRQGIEPPYTDPS